MCGIIGLSRAHESSIPDGRRALVAGLLAIEDRGPHSTGIGWTRGKAEKVWYHKMPGTASDVAGSLDLSGRARIHTAIGHTRYATHGEHTYDNAHPVVADHVVLVHNGVLQNHEDLIRLTGMTPVGEVDSWALAALLASAKRLGHTTTKALELVEGDYAIAWLDSHDPNVQHLARGNGRPMAIGFTKRGDLMMASTPANLKRWATLIGVDVSDIVSLDEGTYLQVVEGQIVEWSTFTPANIRRRAERAAAQRATGFTVPRPLWEPTKGSPAPKRGNPRKDNRRARPRSIHHGITDLYENDPESWWREALDVFGEDVT